MLIKKALVKKNKERYEFCQREIFSN